MRRSFYFLIACLLSLQTFSQGSQQAIYNAYHLSKKIVELERKLKKDTSNRFEKEIGEIYSYLLFYADIELSDTAPNRLSDALTSKKYNTLWKIYSLILSKIPVEEKIRALTEESLRAYLIKTYTQKDLDSNKNVTSLLKNLEKKNKYLVSLQKESTELADVIKNGDTIRIKLDNTLEKISVVQKRLKEAENQLDFDSLASLKSEQAGFEDSITKQHQRIKIGMKKIDDLKRDIDATIGEIIKLLRNNNNDRLITSINAYLVSKNFINDVSFAYNYTDKETFSYVSANQLATEKIIERTYDEKGGFRVLSQADMIDAIAIYLAKRVKQESVMWFFETIKKNAANYQLIKTFFPNTITLLQSNEVYEIPNLGSQWRYALSKDFVKMPVNVFNSPWFKKWFYQDGKNENNKLLFEYLRSVLNIADLLIQRYNYRGLIKQMYLQLSNEKSESKNPRKGDILPLHIFSLLYAINQECFVVGDSNNIRMLNFEDLRSMTKSEIEVMLSLIDLKYDKVISKFIQSGNIAFSDQQINSVRRWLGAIEGGVKQFEKIRADFEKSLEQAKKGDVREVIYSQFNVWENLFGLFDLVIPDTSWRPAWMVKMDGQVIKIKEVTKGALEVYNQLDLRNYAGAVNSLLQLLEKMFYADNERFSLNLITLDTAFNDNIPVFIRSAHWKEYIDSSGKLKQDAFVDSNKGKIVFRQNSIAASLIFERDRHAIQLIRKLAGFLNDVMLATDSKKLAKVVESYALPPGSYKRKRNSWWSLDLNAFVGAYGAYEFARKNVDGNATPVLKSSGWVYGVTAPIGISLSKTFGRKLNIYNPVKDEYIRNPDKLRFKHNNVFCRSSTTLTITASIVDIGAVVSYRFNNSEDSVLPQQPNWAQVFSPGISLSLGLRNTPLVLSAGYQYTPQLRKIKRGNAEPLLNSNRLYIGVLFDLPLANLFQHSYMEPSTKKRRRP